VAQSDRLSKRRGSSNGPCPVRSDPRAELGSSVGLGEHDAFAQSFEDFFTIEHDRLLGALYLVTGHRQEAEDLMQEAFVKVLQRWDVVQSLTNPTAYLYRTAMNTFRTRYRRALMAVRKATLNAGRSVDPFEEVELREDVRRALAGLTPRQRAAIVLTELLGYPPGEAARTLGIKASTVRSLTTQARTALRAVLGDPHE
jgi:RNA polymerase sigma factor (sigma-70 family)